MEALKRENGTRAKSEHLRVADATTECERGRNLRALIFALYSGLARTVRALHAPATFRSITMTLRLQEQGLLPVFVITSDGGLSSVVVRVPRRIFASVSRCVVCLASCLLWCRISVIVDFCRCVSDTDFRDRSSIDQQLYGATLFSVPILRDTSNRSSYSSFFFYASGFYASELSIRSEAERVLYRMECWGEVPVCTNSAALAALSTPNDPKRMHPVVLLATRFTSGAARPHGDGRRRNRRKPAGVTTDVQACCRAGKR
eukprot:g15770.t1